MYVFLTISVAAATVLDQASSPIVTISSATPRESSSGSAGYSVSSRTSIATKSVFVSNLPVITFRLQHP